MGVSVDGFCVLEAVRVEVVGDIAHHFDHRIQLVLDVHDVLFEVAPISRQTYAVIEFFL